MKRSLAFVLDFDGTITTVDISHILLNEHAKSQWRKLLDRAQAGEVIGKAWLVETAPFLPGDKDALLKGVLEKLKPRPGFLEFAEWAKDEGHGLAVATDGYGFYVEPFLQSMGVQGVKVYRNRTVFEPEPHIILGHPNPECDLCGTCKAFCVEEMKQDFEHVAFVGNGRNDRFGASGSHAVFARDDLEVCCIQANLAYHKWDTFFDVMDAVNQGVLFRDPEGLSLCPEGSTGRL